MERKRDEKCVIRRNDERRGGVKNKPSTEKSTRRSSRTPLGIRNKGRRGAKRNKSSHRYESFYSEDQTKREGERQTSKTSVNYGSLSLPFLGQVWVTYHILDRNAR